MVTTLCITSLNQGKIAPRYDLEPKSPEEEAEEAACRMDPVPWQAGQTAIGIWKALFARFIIGTAGRVSPAHSAVIVRS